MSLMHKQLEKINEADLQQLIDTPIYENRVLEYKESLPGDTLSERKELLYDITSFANSEGGEIIYGISEEREEGKTTSKPSTMPGVIINNKDELIRKLENVVRNCVQPRIFSLQMEAIQISNGNWAFIIRVLKSLNSPHMVTLEGSQRFYIRNSAGKHPMDITEIRSSILSSSGLSQRIKEYRLERAYQIKSNEGNTKLKEIPHYIVVHIVPFTSYDSQLFDMRTLKTQETKLKPFNTTGWDHKYNIEGFMTFANLTETHAYVQFSRNGNIESVGNFELVDNGTLIKKISLLKIEHDIVDRAFEYLMAQKSIGIFPPTIIAISLLGVKGFSIALNPLYNIPNHGGTIEQEDVFLPELIIENYPQYKNELFGLLQKTFDVMWNAAGWPKSLNYDSDGNWKGNNRRLYISE